MYASMCACLVCACVKYMGVNYVFRHMYVNVCVCVCVCVCECVCV